MKSALKRRPAPATLIALLALFVALGGPAEARRLISGKLIKRGTISSKQVKDRGLAVRDLSRGARRSLQRTPARSIGTSQLKEGAVGAAQLAPGSVTAAALTANSVSSANIIDKQVGNADLADSAVTAGKIGTSAVRKSELAAGAVGTAEIANGVVTADKLADGSVTGAKIADGTLAAPDVADTFGAVTVTFSGFTSGCATATAPAPALVSGETVADDVLVATPPSGWPAGLSLTAEPGSDTTVEFTTCRIGSASPAPSPAANTTIRLLGVDVP